MIVSKIKRYFFYIIPVLLLSVYDFTYVTYDSEPDYVASVFHIAQFGLPLHSLHPGILAQYIMSMPVIIGAPLGLSIDILIIFMRLIELSFFSILIITALRVMKVSNKYHSIFYYLLAWLLIVLYPPTSEVFRYITGEILLFGFSFLLSALWFKFLDTNKGVLLVSILLGAAMNAKISFLLLLVVLMAYHMLHFVYYKQAVAGVTQLVKIILLGVFWFLLFSLPRIFQISTILQDTFGNRIVEMVSIINNLPVWIYIIFSIGVLLLLWTTYFSLRIKWLSVNRNDMINRSIRNGWIVGLPILIFLVYKYIYYLYISDISYLTTLDKYEDIAIIRRNSVALYAFIVFLVINTLINNKFLSKIKLGTIKLSTIFLLSSFLLVSHISSSKELMINRVKSDFDLKISEIKTVEENMELYIHRDNYFDSVVQFYMWAHIRHGRCMSSLFDSVYKRSFPDFDFNHTTYMSSSNTLQCNNNDNTSPKSLLESWRNIPNNTIKLPICKSLSQHIDINKIYLIHKDYVDETNYTVVVNPLRESISKCGYELILNDVYTNNKIAVYNIVKK